MKQLFNVIDVDNSGKITVSNIKAFMAQAGEAISEAEVTAMFKHSDVTADGMVSYEEFERVVHLHEAEQQTMRELFDALDVSGTGHISAEDLTVFLEQTGEAPELIPAMIAAADTSHDGVVSYAEFIPMIRNQLGAVTPASGWGHQTHQDVISQLLENPLLSLGMRARFEAELQQSMGLQHSSSERSLVPQSELDVVLSVRRNLRHFLEEPFVPLHRQFVVTVGLLCRRHFRLT